MPHSRHDRIMSYDMVIIRSVYLKEFNQLFLYTFYYSRCYFR